MLAGQSRSEGRSLCLCIKKDSILKNGSVINSSQSILEAGVRAKWQAYQPLAPRAGCYSATLFGVNVPITQGLKAGSTELHLLCGVLKETAQQSSPCLHCSTTGQREYLSTLHSHLIPPKSFVINPSSKGWQSVSRDLSPLS